MRATGGAYDGAARGEPRSSTPATDGARAGEPLWPRTRTTRSSPTAFLDVPGLQQVESQVAVSDESGAFSIDAGSGAHELMVLGTEGVYAPNPRVSLRPHQDAEVTIMIACPCCEP